MGDWNWVLVAGLSAVGGHPRAPVGLQSASEASLLANPLIRNEPAIPPSFEACMRLDLAYIDNWSLTLDLKILARTVPAVVLARGAN